GDRLRPGPPARAVTHDQVAIGAACKGQLPAGMAVSRRGGACGHKQLTQMHPRALALAVGAATGVAQCCLLRRGGSSRWKGQKVRVFVS
ncbi:hypothetical protein B296_00035919, partial [Ensete ventricosum]